MNMTTPSRLRAVLLTAVLAAASSPVLAGSSAWLVQASGRVEVTGPAGTISARPPMLLAEGATVKTGSAGSALIMTADGSKIQVRPGSSFTFAAATPRETTFSLLMGAISCWVRPQSGRLFNVRAPGAVAAVRGTVFDVVTDGALSHVDVFAGAVDFTDSFGRVMAVAPGQRAEVSVVRGLIAAPASLPSGVAMPTEPPAALPPPGTPASPAPQQQPAPAAAPSQSNSPSQNPPPPAQQQSTVSPSAP